jgi:hypothetical protein
VKGNIDFRKAAPYLGIGWGNALKSNSRWSFNTDIGAYFQGNPKVKLGSYGCTVAKLVCDLLVQDIAVEQLNLQDDVDSLKVYPVLRASLTYRF